MNANLAFKRKKALRRYALLPAREQNIKRSKEVATMMMTRDDDDDDDVGMTMMMVATVVKRAMVRAG
jgi:hypothetical protein